MSANTALLCRMADRIESRPSQWRLIRTAPIETEILVGRFNERGEFHFAQSAYCFDPGNVMEGEPACWFWHADHGAVEEPTHWMHRPTDPPRDPEGF